MPPIADDAAAPAPTKIPPPKKPRTRKTPTKKPAPVYGPVAPHIAAQQSPTRVSRPAPAQRQTSPIAPYTDQIFNRKKQRVVEPSKIVSKSSNDLGDFLRGLSTSGRGDIYQSSTGAIRSDAYDGPDPDEDSVLDRLTSFRAADQALGDGSEIVGRREELQDFLSKIMPQNYDPEYGGVRMPEAWKHRGNDINKPLKPHWDAQEIASNLSDFDPGSSFARFAMNDILEKQLRNQSNWVKRETIGRAYRLQETLKEAQDAAFDGDFDYLSEKLKKNPDLLEFAKYKDDYTVGPDEIWDRWTQERNQYNGDEYVKGAMRARTDDLKSHYEYVRKYYSDARKVANRAIKKYEKSYNRSVEFALNSNKTKKVEAAEGAGPAIPERDANKGFLDAVGNANPEQEGSERFLGDREQAKRRLGVKNLPSVKDMLASLVAQGQIDPENDGELAAWISRLQNPNHPDTRAMYVAFARQQNKNLDLEGDALDFINEPINSYISKETAKAEREAAEKAAAQTKSQDIAVNSVTDVVKSAADPRNWLDRDRLQEDIAGDIVESAGEVAEGEEDKGSVKAAEGLFWTFDKLARASYAVAGATDQWNRLDQDDPKKASAWWNPITQAGPLGVGPATFNLLQGKNLQDSIDDVWNDPSSLARPAGEAYQQFFRGSDLPGIDKNTVPITFSQVIGNNALWDSEDNLYDKDWYQHTAGFAIDVGADPLNLVGVGVVNTTLKTPVEVMRRASRASKEISDSAVLPSRLLRELHNPNMSPKAEWSWRVQQVLARQGDEYHGDALITDAGANKMQFTVEYGNDLPPVGNAGTAPNYTNARFFAETKVDAAEITHQIKELQAQQKAYPGIVAVESFKKDLQNIVDEMDLDTEILVPELRVRTLMAQAENSININVQGVPNLKLSNFGGRFWRDVADPKMLEDATAAWPGHRSSTKFSEFTDEAGNTRLTEKAAAARRALDEEETFYKTGSIPPEDAVARWNKALDEATDAGEMRQVYDVKHFLDEGAPGLFSPEAQWTPLKAYAKGSGLTPERFSEITGWTNEDIIRSLVRGPELLKKQDPSYAARIERASERIRFSKQKLSNPNIKPGGRAAAYKALQMAYRDMSQATLEGSFRYLDGLRGPKRWVGSDFSPDLAKAQKIDEAIAVLDEIDTSDEAVRSLDESGDYYGSFGKDNKGDTTFESGYDRFGQRTYDGSYRDIDLSEFNSVEDALNSIDVSEFPSKQAQVEALRRELESQKKGLNLTKPSEPKQVASMSDADVIRLDSILPVQSQFRKSNGDFDVDAISKHIYHNKEELAKNDKAIFKVSYRLQKPADETSVEFARYSREARFLDVIAKKVEEKADELFRVDNAKLKASKREGKPVSEGLQDALDEHQQFWITRTVKREGKPDKKLKEGPSVRRLGFRPTYKSVSDELQAQYPNTFKAEKGARADELNTKRNPDAEIDVDQATGTHTNVKWDFARGTGKTAASRRIEAIVKSRQRQWDKAVRTAQETDRARYAELQKEIATLKQSNEDFQLSKGEIQKLYNDSFNEARKYTLMDAVDHKAFMAKGANARLTLGENTAALQRQAANEIRFEELKLKIAKAETDIPEELAVIERKRKELIKKKIALYDRVKKVKMEAQTVRVTMMKRIGEEEYLQALSMPERMDARALEINIMGMKKQLQFTSAMFKGAEIAEQFVPASVWAKWQDTFYRPSKQVDTVEGVEIRAQWEGKTPVVIHSLQKKLTKAMANTTESERSAMLMAYRKGVPYGGPKQLEFQRTVAQLDEIMDIINGKHHGYMFKQAGKTEAKALTVTELMRFLPPEYAPEFKVLMRSSKGAGETTPSPRGQTLFGKNKPQRTPEQEEAWVDLEDIFNDDPLGFPFSDKQLRYMDDLGGDANAISNLKSKSDVSAYIDSLKNQGPVGKTPDPFAPIPEANFNFTFDDLMNAIESNGKATPKDLIDPFRVAWVYNLAAGQASSYKAGTKAIGETFGVPRPVSREKAKLWNELSTKYGWSGHPDIPDVLFPPESAKEVATLMKFMEPGPEQVAIVKMMDQAIGYWKQGMTIYNPAYYTRNGIGEMMVSWLDGVNSPKWYSKSRRVLKYYKQEGTDIAELVQRYDVLEGKIPVDVAKGNEVALILKGGLKVRYEDVMRGYIDQGLMSTFANTDIGQGVRGLANESLATNPARRGLARANRKVHEVGEGFEDYLRLAHYMHALEHSGKGSLKEAQRYAAQRVRRSHFDYTDFSDFEKTVMLRAFPFYKWIRRGAPLMLQHLFMTPGKMIAAPKAMDYMSNMGLDPMNALAELDEKTGLGPINEGPVLDTQDVYEDKNGYLPNYSGIAPAWIRDLFAYQMQPAADDEYANFFRVALPQFDGLQGLLSFGEGNFGDSTAYTLMNPAIKAPIELGLNRKLDPDSNFPIVGGQYNENLEISDNEARGAYLAQQANPWTSFLAKMSRNGKLPDGLNISSGESGRDATRDVASFFSGMGLYQSKLTPEPDSPLDSTAVGQGSGYSEVPQLSGRAASKIVTEEDKNQSALKKLIEANTNTFDGEESKDSAKGWIDFKSKKSGWIPNKYGKKSRRGGYSGGGSFLDLIALMEELRSGVDQGRVIDLEAFDE
jgi:hypothetical protein